MKTIRFITLMLILCTILSSCRSVYIDPEKELSKDSNTGSENVPVIDPEEEYFTDGSVHKAGDRYDGFFYEGCWIYVEKQRTLGPRGLLVKDGKEYIKYDEIELQRIVKYNPATGVTSSPCLDPVCNHSLESGCLMLLQPLPGEREPDFSIQRIIGDWMIFYTRQEDSEYVSRKKTTAYNLKTGESRSIFEEDLSSTLMTRWDGGCLFDGKYYNVKQILDYSKTGYKQGGEGQNVLDYTPKTRQILCEHDFDAGKVTELFEIPDNYYLITVSSKRFFFWDDTGNMHCCNRDGSDMRKEKYLRFRPENLFGTYAFVFTESENGFSYFDLKTNEKKPVDAGFHVYKRCALADDGVLFDRVSTYEESLEFRKAKNQFIADHMDSMSQMEAMTLYNNELNKLLYGGTAQIYMTDFDGSNMRLIYEEENAAIESIYAKNGFVFAIRTKLNEDHSTTRMKCVIDTKTGEIIIPPLLDIVTPDWYVNDPSVFRE